LNEHRVKERFRINHISKLTLTRCAVASIIESWLVRSNDNLFICRGVSVIIGCFFCKSPEMIFVAEEKWKVLVLISLSCWIDRSWQEAVSIVFRAINDSLSGSIPVLLVVCAMETISQSFLVMLFLFSDIINRMERDIVGQVVIFLVSGLGEWSEWLMNETS
jgi:hypothetical protein